ncbi:MAG: TIGR04348 family glycosyltransferase [Deltaproteobacteria bacterium]|nr:MAG: TIGR04348 family glycosyltransferase [Deltaproteobacteria bacterium]TMQ14809.1 MAG: TIGR04348 family glycosyltransferase [Deltaproteobacteria bacterium]
MTAFIATPAPAGSTAGNRITALRWAKRLRELGWRVQIAAEWTGQPCDLLVALHAVKSHASLVRHAQAHPDGPRVLALTGTDLYTDLGDDPAAHTSLALATRLVVLQPLALHELPAPLRERTSVIRQTAAAPPPVDQPGFTACALAHLREVKDPLLAARAVRLLPDDTRLRVVHLGAAPDGDWADRAREAERETRGRWVWLGARPRVDALRVLGGSRLLVLTSRSEGGANVVTEAIAAGVPVVSTRIAGSLGILGESYPGYVEVGDAQGLARMLERCEREPGFLDELRARIAALRPLVDPAGERASWRDLLDALGFTER